MITLALTLLLRGPGPGEFYRAGAFTYMPAPTLISYTETAWNTGNTDTVGHSKSTVSISWQAGDIVAMLGGAEAANSAIGVPTATGLTFTSQKSNSTASTCATQLATAVAGSNGSSTVTATYAASNIDEWGFGVWVIRNSQGVGNSAEQHTSGLTVSLTPTGADGLIIWGAFDFSAAAVQTITPTPSDTRQSVSQTGRYTIYVADLLDQTSGGAVSYGISGTGAGPFSIVVLEVKAAAGAFAAEDASWTPRKATIPDPAVSVW